MVLSFSGDVKNPAKLKERRTVAIAAMKGLAAMQTDDMFKMADSNPQEEGKVRKHSIFITLYFIFSKV